VEPRDPARCTFLPKERGPLGSVDPTTERPRVVSPLDGDRSSAKRPSKAAAAAVRWKDGLKTREGEEEGESGLRTPLAKGNGDRRMR